MGKTEIKPSTKEKTPKKRKSPLKTAFLEKLPTADRQFLETLIADYPQFRFCLGQKRFSFRYAEPAHPNTTTRIRSIQNTQNVQTARNAAKSTIFIGPPQPFFILQTLHELGHALSGHKDYATHIRRLKIESEAWQRAKTVLAEYQKTAKTLQNSSDPTKKAAGENLASILPKWDQNYVEDCLDTYRDWLHTQSRCKKCGQTRYQTSDGVYHCPFCDTFTVQKIDAHT